MDRKINIDFILALGKQIEDWGRNPTQTHPKLALKRVDSPSARDTGGIFRRLSFRVETSAGRWMAHTITSPFINTCSRSHRVSWSFGVCGATLWETEHIGMLVGTFGLIGAGLGGLGSIQIGRPTRCAERHTTGSSDERRQETRGPGEGAISCVESLVLYFNDCWAVKMLQSHRGSDHPLDCS